MRPLILIIAILLAACAKPEDACTALVAGSGSTRLVAFGDSQTAGLATETSKGCGYSYANILSQRHNMTLINQAVPGSEFVSVHQYDKIMAFDFLSTDYVIISAGFNDLGNHYLDPTTEHLDLFRARLKAAIQRVAPLVAHVAVITPFIPHANIPELQTQLAIYRQTVRDVVAEVNAPNVEVGDAGDAINHGDNYFVDGVHFTVEGMELIADDVEAFFY